MARRIIRTLGQIAIAIVVICTIVFFADSRYRVLPNSLHSALPSHHPGTVVTDITIAFCSSVNPFSNCRIDVEKWYRIEKDLYLSRGWVTSAFLYVERKKEEELEATDKVVIDVKISRLNPGASKDGPHETHWESRPGGLWILRSSKKKDSDSEQAIMAVDILFGADAVDPRPGWHLAQTPLLLDAARDVPPAHLSARFGQVKEKPPVVPRINANGKFKILQISDAHLATGTGKCRDAIGEKMAPIVDCEADPRTMDFIERILEDEKPDMVVLSGDQVEGPQTPDVQSTLYKLAAPFIKNSIPYAAIFGNHDDEGKVVASRHVQMNMMHTLPYSLSEPGPEDIDGVGNYYVEVLAPGQSHHSALTLYFLDSHGLSPDEKHYSGYDWIKPNQIDWFRSTAQSLHKAHAKYSHIHLDMAFIHIPLREFAAEENVYAGGTFLEAVSAPQFNSHFYDALAEEGIVSVGCGHDHVNDYCALRPHAPRATREETSSSSKHGLGPWMCYAGGSGFGGYGGYGGYHRRVRVWEVDTNAGRVTTWKRLECCGDDTKKRLDELVIVEAGRVVAPS